MATFMVQFSYTEQGVKGLLKDGGSKRREATEQLVKSLGGKLVAYYFAFGDYDGFAIVEGVDNVEAAAAALIVGASGSVKTKTTVLLTADEIDKATKKSGKYRAPGQ
ncbi:MAG: GYD domain-containing protein [Anaerolineales bacterium]|nr:MAG: GYD domain-containing protein [Anaerolineales bacterium]